MVAKGVSGSMCRKTVVRWDFRRRVQVVGVGVAIFVLLVVVVEWRVELVDGDGEVWFGSWFLEFGVWVLRLSGCETSCTT